MTFTQPGTFGYKCVIHSQMIGAVRVAAAATAVPAATPLLTALLVLFLLGVGLQAAAGAGPDLRTGPALGAGAPF